MSKESERKAGLGTTLVFARGPFALATAAIGGIADRTNRKQLGLSFRPAGVVRAAPAAAPVVPAVTTTIEQGGVSRFVSFRTAVNAAERTDQEGQGQSLRDGSGRT